MHHSITNLDNITTKESTLMLEMQMSGLQHHDTIPASFEQLECTGLAIQFYSGLEKSNTCLVYSTQTQFHSTRHGRSLVARDISQFTNMPQKSCHVQICEGLEGWVPRMSFELRKPSTTTQLTQLKVILKLSQLLLSMLTHSHLPSLVDSHPHAQAEQLR